MRVLTVHGWAFCPQVFRKLEEVGERVEHYTLGYTSLEEEARRVAERITDETVVVGWSLGATVAVLASSTVPAKGLILVGATPHFALSWRREYIERFLSQLRTRFWERIREFRLSVWGEDICKDTPLREDRAVKLLEEFVETDISQKVAAIDIPTLLVHGKKDPITPFREAKKMLKLNPRLEPIIYDGGHFPKNFTPADWRELLRRFR